MARDSKGNMIELGDQLVMQGHVIRVIEMKESPKGSTMSGAFVGVSGNGRLKIVRVSIEPAECTLVMRVDGTLV